MLLHGLSKGEPSNPRDLPSDDCVMRLVFLVPLVVALCIFAFGIGLYAGVKRTWPVQELNGLVTKLTGQATGKDQFGRLLTYPGKIEIACPSQDQMTAVLLLIGQSNAANSQGQRHQSGDDRVINFSAGHCYRAASPLLGADGELGETWTLLGTKLIQSGLYRTVILIPAAVGGSSVSRWAADGDLNTMMIGVIRSARMRYAITAVLWDQGAEDFRLHTPEIQYRQNLKSLIDTVRAEGVRAPFFITRCSIGDRDWSEDNPISRAQKSLVDDQQAIFDGPNTDHDVTAIDRYDGYHFAATGQEKYTDAWIKLFRARQGL
jgi:Carbohydrate esterase, sialic acid-specific acetylesterase